jgi:cysteine-rich repeat protein
MASSLSLRNVLSSLVPALILVVSAACGEPDNSVRLAGLGSGAKICTPDAFVTCQCPNRDPGMKQCDTSGTAFEVCKHLDGSDCSDPLVTEAPKPKPKPTEQPVENLCGNGTVDPGEACDDGNLTDGDLCSALCLPKGDPASAGTCPGMPVHLWDKETVEASANTQGYQNKHQAKTPCNGTSMGLYGNDRVFAVTAHKEGTLFVKASGASFDIVLFANSSCENSATEVACGNAATGASFTPEVMGFPIAKDQTLYVIVDGGAVYGEGDANITFKLE